MRLLKRWYVLAAIVAVLGMGIWQALPEVSAHLAHASIARNTPHAATSGHIQHVVIMMMENHTFDSLFGTFPNATGMTEAQTSSHPYSASNHSGRSARSAI